MNFLRKSPRMIIILLVVTITMPAQAGRWFSWQEPTSEFFQCPKEDSACQQAVNSLKANMVTQQQRLMAVRGFIVRQMVEGTLQKSNNPDQYLWPSEVFKSDFVAVKPGVKGIKIDYHLDYVARLAEQSSADKKAEVFKRAYGALLVPMSIALRKHISYNGTLGGIQKIQIDQNSVVALIDYFKGGTTHFKFEGELPYTSTQLAAIAIFNAQGKEAAIGYMNKNADEFKEQKITSHT